MTTRAIDIVCPQGHAEPGQSCNHSNPDRLVICQARINAAVKQTREANLKRRAEAKSRTSE